MRITKLLENKLNIDAENEARMLDIFKSKTPQLILLVGLPGSGKSTFVNNYRLKKHGIVASTDDIIERYAKEHDLNYSQAFQKVNFKEVDQEMRNNIIEAGKKGENIIVDQTNISDKSRRSKIDLVPKSYEKHAVVFWPEIQEVYKRLEKREKETGKHIPQKVINSMLSNYVPPSEREGFKSIIFIK
jgi:predicted kinase